jgi:hypothetical protein
MADERFAYLNAYEVNRADVQQLYCRTDRGLWRSVDGGDHWVRLSRGNLNEIAAIACTNAAWPTLYFGGTTPSGTIPSASSTFLYRVDGANAAPHGSEYDLSGSIPVAVNGDFLRCIECHPADEGVLYLGFANYGQASRIWRVDNALGPADQVQWLDIAGNLSSEWNGANGVNAIAVDPQHPDTHLFLGSDRGLYYTDNGGRHWFKYLEIPNTMIMDLRMREADRTLFVFTHGRGAWRVRLK